MRMLHYFAAALIVAVPLLLATAGAGVYGWTDWHLRLGILAAIFVVGLHTLVILFMIVTGRVLREAVRSRSLPREFLEELNVFFAKKAAYPAAVFGAVSLVAAGVLGYGAPALGLSSAVHMLAGVAALAFNLWVFPIEYAALRDNRQLVDRAARELDEIDRELEARGELPVEEPFDARRLTRTAWIVAFSAWMPWIYWGVVEYRGDFGRASIHPWIELSIASAIVAYLAGREAKESPQHAPSESPESPPRV